MTGPIAEVPNAPFPEQPMPEPGGPDVPTPDPRGPETPDQPIEPEPQVPPGEAA
jgi:hypothetical protein